MMQMRQSTSQYVGDVLILTICSYMYLRRVHAFYYISFCNAFFKRNFIFQHVKEILLIQKNILF